MINSGLFNEKTHYLTVYDYKEKLITYLTFEIFFFSVYVGLNNTANLSLLQIETFCQ